MHNHRTQGHAEEPGFSSVELCVLCGCYNCQKHLTVDFANKGCQGREVSPEDFLRALRGFSQRTSRLKAFWASSHSRPFLPFLNLLDEKCGVCYLSPRV